MESEASVAEASALTEAERGMIKVILILLDKLGGETTITDEDMALLDKERAILERYYDPFNGWVYKRVNGAP